ncbi:MAG TPA: transglycosylase SLT domain-containing protein [Longimicrobium sp.]|uniref:lytic transglycosylase domain-containing protein n=1 Tax=Longimicrobium sp. TaxID=2029185 RepID=UPI002EDB5E08
MTGPAQKSARSQYGLAGIPRWVLLALPLILLGGVALGLTSTSVPERFAPRRGVPDTLRELRVALPRTPALVTTPNLERLVEKPRSHRDRTVDAMMERYHLTHTMARMVYDAAAEAGLDPELGFRLIRVESVFDPKAVGQGGAAGLVQMMPGTARDLDPEIDTTRELMDPHTNLRLGFRLLHDNIMRYQKQGGDAVRLGVIAYNRGEISVDRAIRRGRDPENGYGKRVLGPLHHGGKPYSGTGLLPRE